MKRLLMALLVLSPLALLANSAAHGDVETDILQRTVNFVIFVAILYYLLADKLRTFFVDRTKSIQAELDKVQDVLKESEAKVNNAKVELENAKQLANEIVESANADINSLKLSIADMVEQEIAYLTKGFDDKIELETKKVKKEVVSEILDELLNSDNIAISQDELANISY